MSGVFLRAALWHPARVRPLFLTLILLTFPGFQDPALGESTLPHGERTSLMRVLNTDPSESKRVRALETLEKAGAIDTQQILRSICDTSSTIRAAMVRIGTPMASNDPELELRLVALAHDLTPMVQMQMLKSLPLMPSPRAAEAFRKLLAASLNSTDPKLRAFANSLQQKTP